MAGRPKFVNVCPKIRCEDEEGINIPLAPAQIQAYIRGDNFQHCYMFEEIAKKHWLAASKKISDESGYLHTKRHWEFVEYSEDDIKGPAVDAVIQAKFGLKFIRLERTKRAKWVFDCVIHINELCYVACHSYILDLGRKAKSFKPQEFLSECGPSLNDACDKIYTELYTTWGGVIRQ